MPNEWVEQQLFDLSQIPVDPKPSARKRARFKRSIEEARTFGAWTLNKLEVLRLYLAMYPRVAGGGTGIDGFAGDGRVAVDNITFFGSARILLDSGAFKVLHLCELPEVVPILEANLSAHKHWSRSRVHPGDANTSIRRLLVDEAIDRSKPVFAFLDPDSTQLEWATVEALATYKTLDETAGLCKVEMWILFNLEQAIIRLWPTDKTGLPPHAVILDRVMGGRDAWLDLWEQGRAGSHLVFRYCERLISLGYAYVYPQQIRDPVSGRVQYWMIHATDHKAAESFMRWAKREATPVTASVEFAGIEWPDFPSTRRRRRSDESGDQPREA